MRNPFRLRLSPITKKRLRRFRNMKRAYWSFWALVLLYAVSLCSELICNDRPLFLRFEGKSYFPAFRYFLAHLFAELGRTQEARREFEGLAASEFAVLPADSQWLVALSLLAEVCVVLGDEPRAEVLYRLLQPDARLHAVAGNATVHFGSVARPLGSLAGLLRRFEEAERHFETALEIHRRLGALPWLAYTQHDFARTLLARGEAADRKTALQLAGDALATARELGMVALAERTEALQQEIQGAIPLRTRRRRSS